MPVKGKASSKARLRASDIKDVETGLENVRREQIALGGLPLSERPAEQIFFLDQTGVTDEAGRLKLRERGLLAKRPLRIDEILRPASQVPPQGRPVAAAGRGGEKRLLEKEVRKIQRTASAAKVATGLGEERTKGKSRGAKNDIQDIWAVKEAASSSSIRKRETAVKGGNRSRSALPLPGTSYRPKSEDLRELLEQTISARAKRLKREHRVREQLPPPALLTGHAGASVMELAVREILSGIPMSEGPEGAANDGIQEEKDGDTVHERPEDCESKRPSKERPPKKTKQERKKETLLKERLTKQRQLEREKHMMQQLNNLKAISRQVRQELDIKAQRKGTSGSSSNIDKRTNRSRVLAEREASLALNLPKEVPNSMRMVRTGCNLIMERFRSLQQRGLTDQLGRRAGVRKNVRRVKTKLLVRR